MGVGGLRYAGIAGGYAAGYAIDRFNVFSKIGDHNLSGKEKGKEKARKRKKA